jgi:hypothetical protein
MRNAIIALVLTGAVATATGSIPLTDDAQNALTSIDSVPTKDQLNRSYDKTEAEVLQSLADLAIDTEQTADPGIRLRAIHALAKYCPLPCGSTHLAHQSVSSVIAMTRPPAPTTGTNVLLLRAAIETMGLMKVASDEPTLRGLLDHPSRDIRAATARALRDLCNTQAITPLVTRYSQEGTYQVKIAISEALRVLEQCSNQ